MKRFLAAVLCLAAVCGLFVFPVRAEGTDVVLDSRSSVFPADTVITGDLILTGDCPETVVLINVNVRGTLIVEAAHKVTLRLQGDSRCEGAELRSNADLIGGTYGEITSDTRYASLRDGSAESVTVTALGGIFRLFDAQVNTLTMEEPGSMAGGSSHVNQVIKNAPKCLFSGTYGEMQNNFDEEEAPVPAVKNHGVEAELTLERPMASPAQSVVRAKLTITKVPDELVGGDYRIIWYIGDTFSGNDWHITLEEGAVFELECSVHFQERMSGPLAVWAELTNNYDDDLQLRFVTPVEIVDYSTAQYEPIEFSEYPYEIHLLRDQNVIIVYGRDDQGKYTKVVNVFVCSVGYYNPTTTGEFAINLKARWGSLMADLYGQYSSQFNGNLLFHSVPYRSKERFDIEFEEYNKLGEPASSGCVRVSVSDAMWIYDHCRQGTRVLVYDKGSCPVEKPVPIHIPEDARYRGWDPTDPYAFNPTKGKNVPSVEPPMDRMTTRIPPAPLPW